MGLSFRGGGDSLATSSAMPTRFDADTDLVAVADDRYAGGVEPAWWIERGPNGGYITAMVLRGLSLAVASEDHTPRSLTVHFLRPPQVGAIELATTIERVGRTMTTVSGRLVQDGRLIALALGAFGLTRPGPEFADVVAPDIPAPETIEPRRFSKGLQPPPFAMQFEQRAAIGAEPFSGAAHAESGGWLRLAEPRPLDHLLVAAMTDAWIPSVFSRLTEPGVIGVPTIDLTVHFRGPLPPPGWSPGDFCLVRFRTRLAAQGFMEEDGEIWSPDGVLLAQSRQLATFLV
jgi:acyl-CoA thioesterase